MLNSLVSIFTLPTNYFLNPVYIPTSIVRYKLCTYNVGYKNDKYHDDSIPHSYSPAASPFPSFRRVPTVIRCITATLGQLAGTAPLRYSVHHSRACNRINESRLFATCYTENRSTLTRGAL